VQRKEEPIQLDDELIEVNTDTLGKYLRQVFREELEKALSQFRKSSSSPSDLTLFKQRERMKALAGTKGQTSRRHSRGETGARDEKRLTE
jgi:hypothetical protein